MKRKHEIIFKEKLVYSDQHHFQIWDYTAHKVEIVFPRFIR